MYIKVKTIAGAKKESFEQKSKTVFEIKIKERAKRNLANKKIIELIARHFGVSAHAVRIVNGHHYPHKLLSIER